MSNWPAYIEKTKNKHPRPLLVRAMEYVEHKDSALDVGAGALNDSRFLLESGFRKVTALDIEAVPEVNQGFDRNIFSFQKSAIEDFDFPADSFDLVNAQFVLPFVRKSEIGRVMDAIKKSLHPNGIFVGQFFGLKDSWAGGKDVSAFSRKEVKKFLEGLDIIYFDEEENDKKTLLGPVKHWHIFHFIAKRK